MMTSKKQVPAALVFPISLLDPNTHISQSQQRSVEEEHDAWTNVSARPGGGTPV